MKVLYKPEYEPLVRSTMTGEAVARKIGVNPQTVFNWRHRLAKGLPMPTDQYHTDYPLIDRLIAEKRKPAEIARIAGCSPTLVSRRMKGLTGGGRAKLDEVHTGPKEHPLILPADSLPLALRIKMKGWTAEHREAFMASQEGAKWAAQILGAA